MKIVLAAVILASSSTALAGECGWSTVEPWLASLERYAKDPKAKLAELDDLCMKQDIIVVPAKTRRLLAACEGVLAHDPKLGWCVKYPIELGHKKLGAIDLFDTVEQAFTMNPLAWDSQPPLLYIKLDDPRAMPRLIAGWKAQLAKPKQPKAAYETRPWARFRTGTSRFLGKHGGATEKAFLEAQLAVTREADVRRALAAAVTEIDKRLRAP